MTESFHDKLMSGGGSGAKTASFDGQPPITHKGFITRIGEAPDIDPKTKQVKTWPSGDPKPPVIVVTIQTDERDASDPEDDGQRSIFLKWKIKEAVADAVQKSGARFDIGGFLAVQFTHQDAPAGPGVSGVKHYVAAYQPPPPAAAAALNAMAPPAAPAAAAPVAQQAAPVFDPASLLPQQ